MQIQTSRIHPQHSWRKVSGGAPFVPLRREDAVARPKSQEDLSMYASDYRLREEAHKSWQHAVTEELVYIADVGGSQDHPSCFISEVYLEGHVWIEVQFAFVGQRNSHYSAIIESLESHRSGVSNGKMKQNFGTIGGDSPMLVEVTHCVQPPQMVRFNGCSSICWLKVSDNGNCIGRNVPELDFESAPAVIVPLLDNREFHATVGDSDVQLGQAPNQLVKTGPHTVEGISTSQRNMVGDLVQLNPEDISLVFKIILTRKSAGIRFMEGFKVGVKSLKVTLRPIQLQIGVSQSGSGHNAP